MSWGGLCRWGMEPQFYIPFRSQNASHTIELHILIYGWVSQNLTFHPNNDLRLTYCQNRPIFFWKNSISFDHPTMPKFSPWTQILRAKYASLRGITYPKFSNRSTLPIEARPYFVFNVIRSSNRSMPFSGMEDGWYEKKSLKNDIKISRKTCHWT